MKEVENVKNPILKITKISSGLNLVFVWILFKIYIGTNEAARTLGSPKNEFTRRKDFPARTDLFSWADSPTVS